jgi:uncharacterized damage-inducible protein DinB
MASATQLAPAVSITFADLLRYQESETAKWRAWLEEQPPELLDLPFGDAAKQMGSVRGMLWHIFIVEWVYACVINDEPFGGWSQFQRETLADLFVIRDQAHARLSTYLARATEADMTRRLTLTGDNTTIHGSARKFLAHTFFHSLRHWAQLATVLRQHGHQTDWHHDFVLSDVME